METLFGEDFSTIQCDLGQAAEMKALNANATSSGERIAFADASPSPELVAEELAHVVQTRMFGAPREGISDPRDASEREAGMLAQRAARGEPVQVSTAPTGLTARSAATSKGTGCTDCPPGTDLQSITAEAGADPSRLSGGSARQAGSAALSEVGYEALIQSALQDGLLDPAGATSEGFVQRSATFGTLMAPWLLTAGGVSQVDSPLPGPADLVALGILAVGLVATGAILMSQHGRGNQADTGIMNEVEALIAAGAATAVCQALSMLMSQAKQNGDRAKQQRIKKTQKAKGCRGSRNL